MKIHIISNSIRMNSGFSVVAKNLAIGLKKLGHDITFTGMQTAYLSEWGSDIEVLPIQTYYVDDITQSMITIGRIKPDIVLAIFQMDNQFNDFAKLFPKTVIYCPVEGSDMPQKMINDLSHIKANGGAVVAQTKYGQERMKSALIGMDIPYIYHGFDDKIYKPLNFRKGPNYDNIRYCYYKTEGGKLDVSPILLYTQGCYDCQINKSEEIKCQYYKEEHVSILKFVNGKWTEQDIPITDLPIVTMNRFVFGFVGQNLGTRKKIERLLRAYYLFIKDSRQLKDRTLLHLHCMPISVEGVDLIKIIQDLGIQDNVIFSYGNYRSSGWTDEGMNILYNTFDVNVSASSSEGFCLPVLESMACGKPNVAPNCTAFTELIGNEDKNRRGLLALIVDRYMLQDGTFRDLVSEGDLARQMKEIYQNKDCYNTCSKNAIKFAESYTWEKIVKQWDQLLKTI